MSRPARRVPQARAMIVAPQPEAVEAGAAVLGRGGTAVDAVLACALVQGVVDPMMCGVGGLGVMQVLEPGMGRHVVINGLSTCPAAAREDMWAGLFQRECVDGYGYEVTGAVNELGHAAVTTPGILRVFAQAHAEFGRTPWAGLFEAAIACAAEGWMVRPHVATMFALDERPYGRGAMVDKLAFTQDGRGLYLRPDGSPKRPGDRVVNTDLAATLGLIARDGVDVFYHGDIAQRIAAEMERQGGLLTRDDLARFAPSWEEPLAITYRGRTIALPGPPAGGIVIAEILRLVERFDLVALGHNSPDYIRVLAEAMKIAARDRERHIGDPLVAPPPLDRLLSDAYADANAGRIRAGEKTSITLANAGSKDTTTISCVDADGMVVSLTHTLGLPSGVIPPGTGFMLNGAMNWYDPRPGKAGSIAPGKRRFSSMSPTIVLEAGRPVATLGAPGGAWIGVAILQALLNLLDWGMTMQEAVSAPRFSATTDVIDLSNRIPLATEKAVQAMGYVTRRSPQSYAFAAVHGISLFDGMLEGGADPQRDGYAASVV